MSGMRDRLIAEIEEWLWGEQAPPAPEPTAENTVLHDTFDEMTWEFMKGSSGHIARANRDFGQFFETGQQAFEDLYYLLYLSDPRMLGLGEMLPEFRGNHHVIEAFHESEEVADLRKLTFLDDFQSGFALLSLEKALYDALDRLQKAQQAQDGADAARDASAQALADALAQGAPDGALQQALGDAQAAAGAAQQAQEDLQQVQQDVGLEIGQAALEAADEIRDANQTVSTFGYGPGQLRKMDFDRRRELVTRLHKGRMAKLAKMLGGWKPVARAERRRRVKHEPGEVFDFELTNNLKRLASSELLNLAAEETEDMFWLRWVQHGLLTRKTRGDVRAGRGPVIVVCDESQSMDTALDQDGNTREMWSKAVTLCLAEQAKVESRDFTYIGFTSKVVYEDTFAKGKIPFERLVDFVEHFGNGGTAFGPPLQRTLQLLVESQKRHEARPDIVFITDGEGKVPAGFIEQWQSTLEVLDATCFAIKVGDTSRVAVLNDLTDRVIYIDRLGANPEGVAELFRNI